MSDTNALNIIAEMMSGNEWNADLIENVADIVRATGREIADVDGAER